MPQNIYIKEYPHRVDIDEYLSFVNDEEYIKKYELLKKNINFKTGRRLKTDSRTYNKIADELNIKNFENYKNLINSEGDLETYITRTKHIHEQIDRVNEENKLLNVRISGLRDRIERLEFWEDHVEFEGVFYGIPIVWKGIHRENNCNGKMVFEGYTSCSCDRCKGWNAVHESAEYYKCDTCNFIIPFSC
jgi:hypothetical protein